MGKTNPGARYHADASSPFLIIDRAVTRVAETLEEVEDGFWPQYDAPLLRNCADTCVASANLIELEELDVAESGEDDLEGVA